VRVERVAGPGRPITIEVQRAAERAGQVILTGEGVVMVVGQDGDDGDGLGQHRPVLGAGEQVPVLSGCVWPEDLLPRLPPFREVGVPANSAPVVGEAFAHVPVERADGVGVVPVLLAAQCSCGP